jgi:hypothetical protein
MVLTGDDLDGTNRTIPYDDGTFVRVAVRRTSDVSYPSRWRYALHYGARDPDAINVPTLADGTIRRYLENRRFSTTRRNGSAVSRRQRPRGHERPRTPRAPDPEPAVIEFPGMVELYERFWSEIPKARADP